MSKLLYVLLPMLLLSACASTKTTMGYDPKDTYFENSWQKKMLESTTAFDPKLWAEWDKKYPLSDDTIVTICDLEKGVCISK